MTVVPVLKDIYCPDIDLIESWTPDDDAVLYWLELSIGSADDEGSDTYQAMVATSEGVASAKQDGIRIGPHPPVIVGPYSWQAVVSEIQSRLSACEGRNWLHVQDLLREHFLWEYEGHK